MALLQVGMMRMGWDGAEKRSVLESDGFVREKQY
jgi:hypothetical protein